jgi:Plavaka transposase
MFVLIILGSDKTTVSVATGQNKYYPLYLSIGNIHNNVHRAHCNSVVLLGFLAIPKSKSYLTQVGAQMTSAPINRLHSCL